MFGRKRKLLKADVLRKQANSLVKKQDKLIDKWIKENEGKTEKEQKVIDNKYGKLLDVADEQAETAYKNYYDFVHKNFKKSEIDEAVRTTKNFMGKGFLKKLSNRKNK